jgi:hypothetical protein
MFTCSDQVHFLLALAANPTRRRSKICMSAAKCSRCLVSGTSNLNLHFGASSTCCCPTLASRKPLWKQQRRQSAFSIYLMGHLPLSFARTWDVSQVGSSPFPTLTTSTVLPSRIILFRNAFKLSPAVPCDPVNLMRPAYEHVSD